MTDQLLPYAMVVTTWIPDGAAGDERLEALRTAIQSWQQRLQPAPSAIIVVDDCSSPARFQELTAMVAMEAGMGVIQNGEPSGMGVSLHLATTEAKLQEFECVLYAVDDWMVADEQYLGSYLHLMARFPAIGAVRIGTPHPGLQGVVRHFPGMPGGVDFLLQYDRDSPSFVVSHRPTLWRTSALLLTLQGDLAGLSSVEVEQLQQQNWRTARGAPDILQAMYHPWRHIDTVSWSGVRPGEREALE